MNVSKTMKQAVSSSEKTDKRAQSVRVGQGADRLSYRNGRSPERLCTMAYLLYAKGRSSARYLRQLDLETRDGDEPTEKTSHVRV